MSQELYDAERTATHPLWPSEMIDRYRRGGVSREDLMAYLASFPYVPPTPTYDPAYEPVQPGEFFSVSMALSSQEYAELYARMHPEPGASAQCNDPRPD